MPRDKDMTYRIMSAIKSKDTTPERLLSKAMWKIGLRYRKHYKIDGKPDFVFVSAKIAVFVDGDFWHGNNWKLRGLSGLEEELQCYSKFWRNKITRNIERDNRVNNALDKKGWLVLRFWESDIRKNTNEIASCVLDIYCSKRENK